MKVSRVRRLLKLLIMVQASRDYTVEKLANQIGVSRRTLFRDLDILKAAGVPIEYNSSEKRFVVDKDFFLPSINFTFDEVLALMLVVERFRQRRLVPNGKMLRSAMLKIESALPIKVVHYCGSAIDKITYVPEQVTDATATETIFEKLWNAAQQSRRVRIKYDSFFEKAEVDLTLDPYRLLFMSRGWYLIAYSHDHRETRTFKIDRILETTFTDTVFPAPLHFNLNDYFGNAWRMIKGDRRFHVRVRFSPKVAGNVEEVLWHDTQKTERTEDGSLIFEVDVDGIDEITWWILGYGQEAVVEEPLELRLLIRRHIRKMAAQYGMDLPDPNDMK